MANRAEVSKSVAFAVVGAPTLIASASKVVAYAILEPGESEDTSNRQGHVYTRIIRRDA